MRREELKSGLEHELTLKDGCFQQLRWQLPWLDEFKHSWNLVKTVNYKHATGELVNGTLCNLIRLYHEYAEHDRKTVREMVLATLLLALWDDMEEIYQSKRYQVKRLGEGFAEVYESYIIVIADKRVFQRILSAQGTVRSILKDEAKQFIRNEYRKQCVYEL